MMSKTSTEAAQPNVDQIALDTADAILKMFFDPMPGFQLKAKIQEAVIDAILASPQASQPIGQTENKADYERGFDDGFILGAEKGRFSGQPVSGAVTDAGRDRWQKLDFDFNDKDRTRTFHVDAYDDGYAAALTAHQAPSEKAVMDAANEMRLTLIGQIHELIDVAERSARRMHKQGDTEERDYIEGAIRYARKVTAPYNYNGPYRDLQSTPAQAPVSVPEGWKLVPIEPTPEMMKAGFRTYSDVSFGHRWYYDVSGDGVYKSMLAAAPAQAQQSEKDAQDAKRYRWAVSSDDNAEALYSFVMSHSPDVEAINRLVDAALASEQNKASGEKGGANG